MQTLVRFVCSALLIIGGVIGTGDRLAMAAGDSIQALREVVGDGPLGIQVTPVPGWNYATLHLSCPGGVVINKVAGPLKVGQTVILDVGLDKVGSYHCTGSLTIKDGSGEGEMPLDITFVRRGPIRIEVPRELVDIKARQLAVVPNQPLDNLEIAVLDPDGVDLQTAPPTINEQEDGSLLVVWQQRDAEILLIKVTGYVGGSQWTQELSPWWVEIPHQEIVFDSGKADIRRDQVAVVDTTYQDIKNTVERYGKLVTIRLYVVGYTDTVGHADSNRDLSKRRASSIARAFIQRGFSGPVYTWGLGEEVLAKETPDEIDEEANRRAVYILSVEAPPTSPGIPYAHWKQIQ